MEIIWREIQAILAQQLDAGQYKVWVAPLQGRLEDACFAVFAQSEFAASFVRARFLPAIEAAVAGMAGTAMPVAIRAGGAPALASAHGDASHGMARADDPKEEQLGPAPITARLATRETDSPARHEFRSRGEQYPLPFSLPAGGVQRAWWHSFDDFVVGPCNELAFAAARSISRSIAATNQLFLSSPPGLGKTHLMQAVGRSLCQNCHARIPRVEYMTAEEFSYRFRMAVMANDMDQFKAKYRDVDVLLLEDVHVLQKKEKTQEELLATLNALNDKGGKVVLSSSFMPREMKNMESQLLSRFSSGHLTPIDRPNRETRKRIVQEKAKLHQLVVPDDVAEFLATNIDSDVRQIESCISSMALKAKVLNSGITMHLAHAFIGNYTSRAKILDIDAIICCVSEGYGISTEALRSRSRRRAFVDARHTVFYLARKHTGLTYEEIGGSCNRCHSAVIKGITAVESEMSRGTPLGRQIANIIAIIERNGGIISASS